jgi:hypothetical protein
MKWLDRIVNAVMATHRAERCIHFPNSADVGAGFTHDTAHYIEVDNWHIYSYDIAGCRFSRIMDAKQVNVNSRLFK